LKRRNRVDFEEHEAGIESMEKNRAIVQEFDEIYKHNCERAGKKLTPSQNTALFIDGTLTRLLVPPRTHYADCLRRIGQNMYVSIKIKK